MSAGGQKSIEELLHDIVIKNIERQEQTRASRASTNWRARTSGERGRRVSDVGITNTESRSGDSDFLLPLNRAHIAPQHVDPDLISENPPFLRTSARPAIRLAAPQTNMDREPLRQPFGAIPPDHPTFENFQHVRNRIRRITAINRAGNTHFTPEQILQANQPSLSYSQASSMHTSRATGRFENRAFSSPSTGRPLTPDWRLPLCESLSPLSPSAQFPKARKTSLNTRLPEVITLGAGINQTTEEKMTTLMTKDAPSSEESFQPNRMVLEKRGLLGRKQFDNPKKIRYKGDLESRSFMRQIDELPDRKNCALWIKNLAPSATISEIFKKITVGAVYALYVHDTDEKNNMKAIKLVFMKPGAAAAFLQLGRGTGVWIRGKKLEVKPNRHGYLENTTNQSRVLLVEGPTEIMTFPFWDEYFRQKAELQWDGHRTICTTGKRTTMEFRFARVDGQSQTCLQAILAEPKWKDGTVAAVYGPDPCDPANR